MGRSHDKSRSLTTGWWMSWTPVLWIWTSGAAHRTRIRRPSMSRHSAVPLSACITLSAGQIASIGKQIGKHAERVATPNGPALLLPNMRSLKPTGSHRRDRPGRTRSGHPRVALRFGRTLLMLLSVSVYQIHPLGDGATPPERHFRRTFFTMTGFFCRKRCERSRGR